jgi:hypothetical protein
LISAVQPIEEAVGRVALNPTPEVPPISSTCEEAFCFPVPTRGLYKTPKELHAQVIAYKVTGKRKEEGTGLYGFLGQRRGDVSQHGFSRNTNLVPSTNNGLTFRDTLSNPFQGGVLEPVGASQGIETFLGQSITFFNQTPSTSYNQRWELGLQRIGAGLWEAATWQPNHIETLRTADSKARTET